MNHSPVSSRSGFGTLTIIGVIVAVLLVTGIGQYLWRNATQLGAHCRDLIQSVGWYQASDTCESIGLYVVSFQRSLETMLGESSYGTMMDLEQFAGYMAREFTNSTIGWRAPSLDGLIDPNMLGQSLDWDAASAIDRMRYALTQGSAGSSLLQSGQIDQGLGYLKSSAGLGEYGVLSQLQLGSLYGSGTSGVPLDLGASRQYNLQALQSIETLQTARSPQANRLLNALPASPADLSNQIRQSIGQPY